jgi:acyl-CoA reductase-like NAD-dependent aldehyde dehydrogenase
MAEENFDPLEEGRRIAREYLSKKGWAGEWRRALNTQLYPAVQREELEGKERQVDGMEESAEQFFSRQYDKWRKEPSPEARQVLRGIYELLGQRRDLGFIATRIVERIRVTLTSE